MSNDAIGVDDAKGDSPSIVNRYSLEYTFTWTETYYGSPVSKAWMDTFLSVPVTGKEGSADFILADWFFPDWELHSEPIVPQGEDTISMYVTDFIDIDDEDLWQVMRSDGDFVDWSN